MDELNIHHNPEVLELIPEARHCHGNLMAPLSMYSTQFTCISFLYPKLQDMNDLEAALENIIENYLGLFSVYCLLQACGFQHLILLIIHFNH